MILPTLANGGSINRADIPLLSVNDFQRSILDAVADGQRVASFFGTADPESQAVQLFVILAPDQDSRLRVASTTATDEGFPSLTPRCLQVHLFEREIAEQFGIKTHGHPWFKPVRFQSSYRPGHDAWDRPTTEPPLVGVTDFYRIEGPEVHEVAVGPVHVGIIEPGHFRFQCHGEKLIGNLILRGSMGE